MIIGVCGYGYTGSGAVLDLLKEFNDNEVIDNMEFTISYVPDGLEDLEYSLIRNVSRYFKGDVAIKRFKKLIKSHNTIRSQYKKLTNDKFYSISNSYIDSLIQVKWKGYWSHDFVEASAWEKNFKFRFMIRVLMLVDKIFKRNINLPPNREMFLSIRPDNFYELSKSYIENLIKSICNTKKNIVLDQPFSADNPQKSFIFFKNPKAIIIDRDPRDLFLLAKKVVLSQGRFIPSDDVEKFCKYYRIMRSNNEDTEDTSRILRIRFEDLIYEYEKTKKDIIKFLGLKEHSWPKKYFKPEVSKFNTQLFNKYSEYQKEVEYIEQELEEWLFPFEEYEFLNEHGVSF